MVTPPFDIGHELQRHGDALRQLAFDLVRDSNAADDAVQDVWLAALQRPPRHQDALFGWLATALHNVVRMWRRKQRRRDRHEAEAAAARDTIDHGEARSREELGHELLRAVESLEAPYRDAIWQRFFEGKPPRAIAAASGVPLATVKSRLQRGLGMLRERLGAEGGRGDWRRAFAVAFGLRETTATASAAALATGGVLVATWAKAAALAAAAVAISAIWWWPQNEVVAPVAPDRAERVAAAPATAAARPAPNATPEAAAVAREAAPPPPPPAADANASTLRGRCVDEAGLPVAGCTVTLGGSSRSTAQMDAWLNGHPASQWRDPTPVTTDADGAFAFTFAPPPPFRFWMAAEAPGLAWMGANWRSIDAGKVIALGDVVMQPGIEVRGRIVDADGAPCPDAGWQLQPERRDVAAVDGAVSPTGHFAGRCLADGTFVASRRFAAGAYEVQASEGDRKSDAQRLVLTREQPVVDVTLQVKGVKQPAITGRVVDEQGKPVLSARVLASAAVATTNREGRFMLRRPMDEATDTASLRATAEGYETRDIAEPIAWGTAGVDVVLRLRAALVLSVRDEHDAPMVDYTVRCIPVRDKGRSSNSDDARVRARGPHADGVATVPGVSGGTWRIVLEFAADSGVPPWIEDVEIPAAGRRLDVRPQALARRWLRVVTHDGAPVAGTRVQVIDIPREQRELALDSVSDTDVWLVTSGSTPSRIAFEAKTDARGMCELQGQRGRTLGLRVLGPGHAPLAQDDLSLADASELVVEVARGARLTGRITPPDAFAQLVRYDLSDRTPTSHRPTLRLLPANGQRSFTTRTRAGETDSPAVTVAADGSYACESKTAGTWRVVVEYMRSTAWGGACSDTVELARIDLHDGQEARLDLDLGWLMPADLEATVTWNGVRFANAKVWVAAHHGDANGKPDASARFEKATDEHGTFSMMVRPGTFFVTLKSAADGRSTAPLRSPVPAVVVAGRTTAHTFDFTSGKLHVTLVDAAGKPAEGVVVYAGGIHDDLPATDASGSSLGEAIAGAHLLRALPKALAARTAAQRAWLLTWLDDAFAGQWLELGTVTVLAGTTTEIALRLPPEWDRQ